MRALQVVSGNEMYADKQQMLASPTSWETHAPLRDPRPNEVHGTILIMRLVIRTGRVGAT
jgi:hypothetical protein